VSACPTCKSLSQQMPSRIVVVVDGVTHIQEVTPAHKVANLQAACNYLLALIDQATDQQQSQATHG
jgi:hypothetical protein